MEIDFTNVLSRDQYLDKQRKIHREEAEEYYKSKRPQKAEFSEDFLGELGFDATDFGMQTWGNS